MSTKIAKKTAQSERDQNAGSVFLYGSWLLVVDSPTKAWARMSARLVAASTMTPVLPWNPSISVRIWFRVCGKKAPIGPDDAFWPWSMG